MNRDWPTDWQPLKEQDIHLEWGRMHNELASGQKIGDTLELELERELNPNHPIFGRQAIAIGFMLKCPNDFLFALDGMDGPLAWVHLTWEREDSSRFPSTEIYLTWDDFVVHAPIAG